MVDGFSLIEGKLLNRLYGLIEAYPKYHTEVVSNALFQEVIEKWYNSKVSTQSVMLNAIPIIYREELKPSRVPTHFIRSARCKLCGPIWFISTGKIPKCP